MSGSVEEYMRTHLSKEEVEDVLRRGGRKDAKIVEMSVSPLTTAGENYGSVMAAVDLRLLGDQEVHAVAKLIPMSPFLREGFDCSVTVRKEIAFYEELVPEFSLLQPDLDLFPKCEGARATLGEDRGQPIDESAVILLENLKARGYQTMKRLQGLDLPHSELALVSLGRLHAFGIALKLLKPSKFQDVVSKVAAPFHMGPKSEKDIYGNVNRIVEILKEIPACAPHVTKVRDHLLRDVSVSNVPKPRELFSTVIHNDFWTNNMMFWRGVDGKPVGLKIVDFQVTLYDSVIKDVLMFLYTSLELGLKEKSYDHLISVYHTSLTDQLTSLGVDTADYSLHNLYKEIDIVAPKCFTHMFFLHRAIFAEKPPDMAKFSNEDFIDSSRLGELYKVRIGQLINEYVRNGWL